MDHFYVAARSKIRAFVQDRYGGTMVEFAIVAGLVVTPLMLGILEFGYAAWAKNCVVADAREGARYAIVRGSTSANVATVDSVRRHIRSRTALETTGADSVRVYAVWPTNNSPGSMVEVSVAHRVTRRGLFIRTHTDSATAKRVILY
jgi:Flp pilus assembly protein TadG